MGSQRDRIDAKPVCQPTLEKIMAAKETSAVAKLIADNENDILPAWVELQKKAGTLQIGRIGEAELLSQCRDFLHLFRDGLSQGGTDASHTAYKPTRDFL